MHHHSREFNLPRALLLGAWIGLVACVCLCAAGCVGTGTDWERRAHVEVQRALDIADTNTREIAGIAEAANEEALLGVLSDLSSDFAQYSERHPSATPQELQTWMSEAVTIGVATLSARLQSADLLRDKVDLAADNLRQARAISQQAQSVTEAQMAFGERFKAAASKIQESAEAAYQRNTAQREQRRAAKAQRMDGLREQFMSALGVPQPTKPTTSTGQTPAQPVSP